LKIYNLKCFQLGLECGEEDDAFVIAGDTLFYKGFSLADIFNEFQDINKTSGNLVYK